MTAVKVFVIILAIMAGTLRLGLLGSAFHLISLPFLKFDQQVNLNDQLIQKTYNADNALYNNHWFQERQGVIKAEDQNIDVAQAQVDSYEKLHGDVNKWSFEVVTEDNRLRSVVQGLTVARNTDTQEYNARANEADRNIFINNLPTFISLRPY